MKFRKLAFGLGVLLLLYAIIGFFILPSIVKPRLIAGIEEATHRHVSIESLHLNPFALSATVTRFELLDADSTRLLSFARLYINYEIVSLVKNAYVFSEFHLDTPYVAVRVLKNGAMSIQDIVDRPASDTASSSDPAKPIVIGDFVLRQGTLLYQDASHTPPLAKGFDSLNLSLTNFTTMPDQEGMYEFTATTGRNESLHWKGSVSVSPARSAGLLEIKNLMASTLWDFMSDRVKFRVDSGLLDIRAEYNLDASGPSPLFKLRNGGLDISSLVVSDPGDSIAPLSLPRVSVKGIAFDYPAKTLLLDNISVSGGEFRTAYLADGTMTIQDLLTPLPSPSDTAKSNMEVTIHSLNTEGLKVVFIDRMLEPEAPMIVTELASQISNLCYGKVGTAKLKATAVLNGAGTVSTEGTLSLEPRKADLEFRIAGTPFVAFQPYASRYSRARHESGTASAMGTLNYAGSSDRTFFRFRGGVTLDRIRVTDPVLKEDLVRGDRFEMVGMDFILSPRKLTIKEFVATRPYIRVIISPDRTINFQHVMANATGVTDSSHGASTDSASASMPAAAGREQAGPPSAMAIGAVRIIDGTMNFSDLSLTPNFAVSIQQMEGSIRGLSSEQIARADVDITGKVDKYAPATISGQINPLSEEAFTDILMKFQGIELTTFTPYAGKFAGYKIDRGKLNLDLRYKLNKRYLEASNKIVLDQLTLGESVKSPDVTSLPVKLVIALLKDSHGVIDLDIPVSGSIDDPEFSLFPLIMKVLLNILWKIVTAPFALIGALIGGTDADLEHVAYTPGSDSLLTEQQSTLTTVAKGLADRPLLQMDIRGAASKSVDRDALAEGVIMSKVQTSGSGPLTRDGEKQLLTLYRQTFKEDPALLVPQEGMSEEERTKAIFEKAHRKLVDSVQVSENELRALAQRRAAAVVDYLTRSQGIDPARLFLQEPETTANPTNGTIKTTLILTAR
jgi:hypothetical protein